MVFTPLQEIIIRVNRMLVGYYYYYKITDNFEGLANFRYIVEKSLFIWLNRKSQKSSYNWEQFSMMLNEYPLAEPKIYVSIYG